MARKFIRHITSAAAVLALTASAFATSTSTAQAATARNGVCEPGEVCFYHNSNQRGSVSDFTTSIPNYGTKQPDCYDFKSPGKGKGKCIKNDVASVTNRTNKPVTIYFNSNYQGASQTIPAGASANLNSTLKNQNASHRIGDAPTSPPSSGKWASPAPSHARISADYPYYPSGRRHTGVDLVGFKYAQSACSGTVSQIKINPKYKNRNARGVRGSTNYVWIDCGNGVKMGYAHFYAKDLPGHIRTGAHINAGDQLFPIGNQGNSTGTHLHFEVRINGKTTHPLKFLRNKGVKNLPGRY